MKQRIINLNIHDFLIVLRKHIKLLIIFSIICGLAGFVISRYFIIPQYESDAILVINASQSSVSATSITYDEITAAQQLVNTYSIILKSDTVLDQVITNLGLNTDANKLAKKISIGGVNETEVIDITVRDTNPQIAADIANEIIEVAPTVIINTVNAGSVEIISTAKKASSPVIPNKNLNIVISTLAGLFIAVIISLASEMMENTFTSGKDVEEYLDYPLLGVIPNIKSRLVSYQFSDK